MRRRRGGRLAVAAVTMAAVIPAASDPTAAIAVGLAPTAVRPEAVAVLQTPVLSLRRLPELLAQAVGASKLDTAVDAVFADPRLAGGSATSCLIVRSGPLTLYSKNPMLPLLPASNLKLLTAASALDLLGATDRLATTVMADSAPSGGTVSGNLYLVGGGDPLLRTPEYVSTFRVREQIYDDLNTLADRVRAAGVLQVTGAIVGDESRYDSQRYIPSWPTHYATNAEVGPLSALSVNDGFAVLPPRSAPSPAATLPLRPAAEPARQAAGIFASLLARRGIVVRGQPAAGTAPATAAKVSQLDSSPLPDVLGELLRRSDNSGVELITKEIGRQSNLKTASTAAGVAAVRADLAAAGLPIDQLHMVDGSGLDRSDRATCQLILAVLLRSGPTGALAQGLAVAGKSGTLQSRLAGTPAAGRLLAKTGALEGVSALSGFVIPAPGGATPGDVSFSLIENGVPSGLGDALGDRIGVLLATFPEAPPVSALAPLPARREGGMPGSDPGG